jgi:hypothetical protein
MAAVSAWLALPRPVLPGDTLPLPLVDRRTLRLERAADHELAERARARTLPYEVRAIGELVRRFGARQARGDVLGAERAREDAFRARLSAQGRFGVEALRALRALQTELFLSRIRSNGILTAADRELAELSGSLPERSQRAGWTDGAGRPLLTEDELATLYRVRWTDLLGAQSDPELGPKLGELRAYYRILFEHPEGGSPRERDERRLAYAEALGRRDPAFAWQFVRGVLLHRLGEPASAAQAFVEHLAEHPDGPWSLRARNHLLAVLADTGALE